MSDPAARRRGHLGVDALLWLSLVVVPCLVVPGLDDHLLLPKIAAFKALVCLSALLAVMGNRLRRPQTPPLGLALALDLLGGALIASTFMAARTEAALTAAETMACWALWTSLLVPVMCRKNFARNAARAVVLAALLQVFLGASQALQAGSLAAFRGTLSGPQECAVFLGAVFMMLTFGRFGLTRAQRAVGAALFGAAAIACGSWSVRLALVGAGLVMALRNGAFSTRRRAAAAAGLTLCAAALLYMGAQGWQPSLRALLGSHGAGLGLGALDMRPGHGRAPSALLQWLCEGGVALLGAWLLLVVSLARRAFERRHGVATRPWTAVAAFLALASAASTAPRGLPVLLLFGLAAAGLISRRAARAEPAPVSWRRQALLGLLLGCLMVAGRQVRLVGSSRLFVKAQDALASGRPGKAAVLTERALELNPANSELWAFRARLWRRRTL